MVVGFNHNFQHQGVVYHIQTEDGGLGRPNIVTLLYHGGTILASRKTSYADIVKIDRLEKVVEDLMKEQHKGMLRSLRAGEFDDIIARHHLGGGKSPLSEVPAAVAGNGSGQEPVKKKAVQKKDMPAAQASPARPAVAAEPAPRPTAARPAASSPERPAVEASLDEIILSYLMGDEK